MGKGVRERPEAEMDNFRNQKILCPQGQVVEVATNLKVFSNAPHPQGHDDPALPGPLSFTQRIIRCGSVPVKRRLAEHGDLRCIRLPVDGLR
eukprot:gene10846-biopygen4682